jgi:hypothetical protein
MTTIGWILMILTWGLLFSVLGFSYLKILHHNSDRSDFEKVAE